jgi:group I intron endonuclease
MGSLYLVVNDVNGKKYVGKTKGKVGARWKRHIYDSSKNSASVLHVAIKKYGAESFTVKEIASNVEEPALSDLESWYIEQYKTHVRLDDGYNMTAGGDGMRGGEFHPYFGKRGPEHPAYGHKHTPTTRAKMSKSHQGVRPTVENRAKRSKSLMNRVFSDKSKEKMSRSAKGRDTTSITEKAKKVNTGKRRSPETVEKIRQAALRRWSLQGATAHDEGVN